MEAGDIIQDILDRFEGAVRDRVKAETEANEAKGRAFQAEHEAARVKIDAEELRTALSKSGARLNVALNMLTSDQRAQYEAAINPPKTDASGEVIPF